MSGSDPHASAAAFIDGAAMASSKNPPADVRYTLSLLAISDPSVTLVSWMDPSVASAFCQRLASGRHPTCAHRRLGGLDACTATGSRGERSAGSLSGPAVFVFGTFPTNPC